MILANRNLARHCIKTIEDWNSALKAGNAKCLLLSREVIIEEILKQHPDLDSAVWQAYFRRDDDGYECADEGLGAGETRIYDLDIIVSGGQAKVTAIFEIEYLCDHCMCSTFHSHTRYLAVKVRHIFEEAA